ncbi:FAD-dependent monooxygenase [Terriglobus sp. TAA 43]|uniref:FAD-dependent monooxygenase n=1 Tax=Terriglobus sp. TAA 43 TaxID=278961 RepID=UPI000647DC80|nr:FAD-dependent monooxygenase [Terriglobus sp. TAA 43]
MTTECDVLIQGAGIGGLALGIALQQRGYRVRIVERAGALSEVGAGIWMAANAMQVFAQLGFAEKIVAAGWPVKLLRLQDSKSGDIQVTDMSQIAHEYGFETIALHRGVLQRVLLEQLQEDSVRFNCEVSSVIQSGDGVVAKLSDGSSCTAAVLIGADGLHSQIRSMAGLDGEKRYSGSSSYRAIARGAHVLPVGAEHDAYEVWASGCRVGFSKINADDYYWYMTFDSPAGEPSSASERKAHAEMLFRTHFPQWISLLDSTRAEDILRTDIGDLKPLLRWSSGRIGLVGDAAHAATPNLGQGGAMAVEDALALAEAFRKFGLNESALSRFEQLRRKKVDWTVSTSWSIGKICHVGNPLFRFLRNVALRKTPASVTQKQVQRMYRLESYS